MENKIELYRAIVPAKKLINDNQGQHYRTMQGKLDWLSEQFERIMLGEEKTPGEFKMIKAEEVPFKIEKLTCEVWRCNNRLFDPHNYAKTFKAPIDLLTKYKFWEDDNWRYIVALTFVGGGIDAWPDNRAFRYKGDGLPKELNLSWLKEYTDDPNAVLIRIIGGENE